MRKTTVTGPLSLSNFIMHILHMLALANLTLKATYNLNR
jgi:hypothetical protein